jgi:glutamine amidotransferase
MGIPIFGICLGLQMLFTESEEFGVHKGLNIIPGKISKFPSTHNGLKLRVPQIGWNSVHFENEILKSKSALSSVKNGDYFYFVHSFFAFPSNEEHILTKTNYEGFEYCSSVFNGSNIFATQFHPEKSGNKGIQIFKSWAEINN